MRALLVCLLLTGSLRSEVAVTPEARDKAIAKAFSHLDDHLWKLQQYGSPRRQYTMAVAGWAYLLAGDRAAEGRKLPSRKRELARIHDELVRYVETVAKLYDRDDKKKKKRKARPQVPQLAGMRTAQYVWPLGVAAHFFAESAARNRRKGECRKMLKLIVRVLEAAQQENGGWGHDDASREGMGLPPIKIPKPGGGQLTYPGTLLAASHIALAGLGAAHRALKSRRVEALAKGRKYFADAQNGDGSFPYDPSQKHNIEGLGAMMGGLEVARTSGAAFALYLAGAPADDPVAGKAVAAVDKQPEMMSEGHGSAALALQYGALLADARGTQAWRTFRKIYFARILKAQQKDGAFLCVAEAKTPGVTVDTKEIPGLGGLGNWVAEGKTYVTAIHTLILLLDRTDSKIAPEAPAPKGPVTPSAKK